MNVGTTFRSMVWHDKGVLDRCNVIVRDNQFDSLTPVQTIDLRVCERRWSAPSKPPEFVSSAH